MKPTKAFIIMMKDNAISEEYAKVCAESCEKNNTPWEYIEWYDGNREDVKPMQTWKSIGIPISNIDTFRPKRSPAQCATSGHAMAWKKVMDSGEPAIIFEHDAILLHKIDIDIPDGMMVTLGYKLENPQEYNHKQAGAPTEIINVKGNGHEGAHAYAITHNTARSLLKELEERGIPGAIDNTHFLKTREKHTKIPLKIMSPTPAMGWLRQSTIWKKSAAKNYEFIESFQAHYKK